MNNPRCCGNEATWVENVPGKGYFYCRECKKEVGDEFSLSPADVNYLSYNRDGNLKSIQLQDHPIGALHRQSIAKLRQELRSAPPKLMRSKLIGPGLYEYAMNWLVSRIEAYPITAELLDRLGHNNWINLGMAGYLELSSNDPNGVGFVPVPDHHQCPDCGHGVATTVLCEYHQRREK